MPLLTFTEEAKTEEVKLNKAEHQLKTKSRRILITKSKAIKQTPQQLKAINCKLKALKKQNSKYYRKVVKH